MWRWVRGLVLAGGLAAAVAGVSAQAIYSCVDAQGRRHTSDRLIPECMDREQKVFGKGGSFRVVPPAMTPLEQAAQAERNRKAAQEKLRQADERRADRALLTRYPNRAAHDEERARNLAGVQHVEPAAHRDGEIRRINERFDQELARLLPLWAQLDGGAAGLGNSRTAGSQPAAVR